MLQPSRFTLLNDWLSTLLIPAFDSVDEKTTIKLQAMTGDAGFRQYYRFNVQKQSFIAVDAPPQYSNNQAFVAIGLALSAQQVTVPKIIAADLTQGFFCLSDFGDQLLADDLLNTENSEQVKLTYLKAIKLLPLIAATQVTTDKASGDQGQNNEHYSLPLYDKAFIDLELGIFTQWLIDKHLNIKLSCEDKAKLEQCFDTLSISALSQPKVTMHRDFHSRNIMVLNDGSLGVIDFQDAVVGPITYDIVSLLRDCYTRWPEDVIQPLFKTFCQLMSKQYDLDHVSETQWQQWFDLMGLQRHLKASGIFCRLFYRDNKSSYLKDIPLTLSYIEDISGHYPQLSFLHQLIKDRVIPAMRQIDNKVES